MATHQSVQKNSGFGSIIIDFIRSESFGGIFLCFCAFVAMVVANSPLSDRYFEIWEIPFGFTFGTSFVGMSLHYWINDVLMSFFFLMVGLEIKRELLYGELAGIKRAAFPAIAALGGMIVPAAIYLLFNIGTRSAHGFGIPMATDIAFALGVLLLLGNRVSLALKVFLVSLAVVDDLGAVLVIAIFYTDALNLMWFGYAGVTFVILMGLNKLGVRSLIPYLILGVLLWIFIHNSGIHATIAAVALAFTIPAKPKLTVSDFVRDNKRILDHFCENEGRRAKDILTNDQIHHITDLGEKSKAVKGPLIRLEHALHPFSAYLIMPLFAFANAGVAITSDIHFDVDGVMPGIFLGLLLGKPLGILGLTYLAERFGLAARPQGVMWIDILGAGMLAGIGFTMSMFITNLAFDSIEATNVAKLAILVASLTAGILGALFISMRCRFKKKGTC